MNGTIYFLQVNLFLVVFFGFYWLFLRNETYNTNNRIFLVFSAILSLLIPVWNTELVQSWAFTRQLSGLIHTEDTRKVLNSVSSEKDTTSWFLSAVVFLYVGGAILFAIRLLVNIFRLDASLRSGQLPGTAFSFFWKITVDKNLSENDVIYEHELVHVRQVHSFDVIFFEILAVFCWFNPVIYLYKIAIKNVHEFIADEVSSKYMASKADYAMLLLSQQFQVSPHTLVNTFFNYKNLKLRIQMLKRERSGKSTLAKYVLAVPAFVVMLMIFSAAINQLPEEMQKAALPLKNLTATRQPAGEKSVEVELKTTWTAHSVFTPASE